MEGTHRNDFQFVETAIVDVDWETRINSFVSLEPTYQPILVSRTGVRTVSQEAPELLWEPFQVDPMVP